MTDVRVAWRASAFRLAGEYRESMDREVMGSWARDVVSLLLEVALPGGMLNDALAAPPAPKPQPAVGREEIARAQCWIEDNIAQELFGADEGTDTSEWTVADVPIKHLRAILAALPTSVDAQVQYDADCNAEIVMAVRHAAREVFGGNCTFADDDVERLKFAALAKEAPEGEA